MFPIGFYVEYGKIRKRAQGTELILKEKVLLRVYIVRKNDDAFPDRRAHIGKVRGQEICALSANSYNLALTKCKVDAQNIQR